VSVWHQTAQDEELRMEICRELQKTLNLPMKTKIDYLSFEEMMKPSNVPTNGIQYWLEAEGPIIKRIQKQMKREGDQL
jgi:hypothetical protein